MKTQFTDSETPHGRTTRDTSISTTGGVSEGEASTLQNRAILPGGPPLGLVIIDGNVDHDGEPVIGWEWSLTAADQIDSGGRIFPAPGGLGSTEALSPSDSTAAGSLTGVGNSPTLSPINGVPRE